MHWFCLDVRDNKISVPQVEALNISIDGLAYNYFLLNK